MDLLRDPWIPIRAGAVFRQIPYKELLCTEQPDLQVALPRDDLELACIQMLSALTQVIFIPSDKKELSDRIKNPLTEQEYDQGIEKYKEWFDLDHLEWPFMQSLTLDTPDPTPIQKLFAGLPAGNNHAFFNGTDECSAICPSCAGIALFNLCTHVPNMSGKHKGGLRGNAPVSTLIHAPQLRKMVWLNVLHAESVSALIPGNRVAEPVWVKPITRGASIAAADIGMTRGLFWAPVLARIQWQTGAGACDCCGVNTNTRSAGFLLGSDLKFDVEGLWPHPYSPRQLNIQRVQASGKQKPAQSVVSFRTTAPAWTQFSELLFSIPLTAQKEGYIPAAVIGQFHEISNDKPLHLLIGGYRNKQAAILQRRHELYSLPTGWNEDLRDQINTVIQIGLEAEILIADKVLYPLVKSKKESGLKGLGSNIATTASTLFFHFTEPLIHQMLRESSLRKFVQARNKFIEDLAEICRDIFERVTRPYAHKPELIGAVALSRVKLEKLLNKLKDQHTTGGAA